jgi:hypothetical protein
LIFLKMATIPVAALMLLQQESCSGGAKSDIDAARIQEQAAQEANAQTGFPGITSFTEKKMVRMLYELRDKKVATFTYVADMNGRLFHVCDSIGYGLPYGVQFTSPEKDIYTTTSSSKHHNVPQAEPNGLFMPPTAEGTWVICAGEKGALDPMYVEPRVIVSPHKLKASGDWQE